MQNLRLVIAATAFVALVITLSADAEKLRPTLMSDVEPACSTSDVLRVPAGMETWYEGDVLRFQVPEGYKAWTRTASGEYVVEDDGGVECSCSTGDCSPVNHDGTIYCMVGPGCTTSCSRTEKEMAVMIADMRAGVQPASPRDFDRLPFASSEMLEIPAVRAAAERFVQRAFRGHRPAGVEVFGNRARAPEGYVFQPINLFGHLAHVLIPAESSTGDLAVEEESCSCNEGSGCEYWSKGWPANISGCDAGDCTACEMTVE